MSFRRRAGATTRGVALITFGRVRFTLPFKRRPVKPPHLETTGDTPMGSAIRLISVYLGARKQAYKSNESPIIAR